MKNKFIPVLFFLASAASLVLQSCQKDQTLKDPHSPTVGATTTNPMEAAITSTINGKGSSGGGGTSGGGHNGGGGGGGTTSPTSTDPSLAPADTTTSQLPVAAIITVGKWKVTSFVQGNDDLTSQFANYILTFNSDGTMVADDKGNQTTGMWRYQDAIFYYGIPVYGSSPYGFTMAIGTSLPLTSLNENYFISKKTLTTVYIASINPNENAHVTLSKLAQ